MESHSTERLNGETPSPSPLPSPRSQVSSFGGHCSGFSESPLCLGVSVSPSGNGAHCGCPSCHMGLDLKVPRAHVLSGGGMVSSVIHKLEKLVPFFIIKPGTCAVPKKILPLVLQFYVWVPGKRSLRRLLRGSAHRQRLRGAGQGHSQGGPLSSVCSAQGLESRGHGGPCLLCPVADWCLAAAGSLGKPLGIKWEVGPSSL